MFSGKIYTVTLNPAIDHYISFKEENKFCEGKLNKVTNSYSLDGGKGINVSKVLNNYTVPSTALGFVGGFTGDFIKNNLIKEKVNFDFTTLEEETRINIKMNNLGVETEIAGKSPFISETLFKDFLNKFSNLKEGDILVLSGSVPDSLNANIYSNILEILPVGVKVILDTRDKPFEEALKKGVFLVKPNKKELEEFFKREILTDEDLLKAGKELQKLGAKNVLISLGGDGSLLITENNVLRGKAPKGNVISTVGAGDSMVAGIIYGLSQGNSLEESLKYGIASGSSTAFSKGVTTLENMKNLLPSIKINYFL
ncbi:MAG: 1-phosphofructokinase [Fusobacteriaceae bacterium]